MKIIIDIPRKAYKIIKAEKEIDWLGVENILDCIKSGTPLPEGHGDLMILSKNKLKENQMNLNFSCQKWIDEVGLSNATVAILEAESEE